VSGARPPKARMAADHQGPVEKRQAFPWPHETPTLRGRFVRQRLHPHGRLRFFRPGCCPAEQPAFASDSKRHPRRFYKAWVPLVIAPAPPVPLVFANPQSTVVEWTGRKPPVAANFIIKGGPCTFEEAPQDPRLLAPRDIDRQNDQPWPYPKLVAVFLPRHSGRNPTLGATSYTGQQPWSR